MKAVFLRAALLIMPLSLAACATTGGGGGEQGGTEVTRMHLGLPVAKGQIAVEAFEPADANSPDFRNYAASVQRQLTQLGWTMASTPGQSEQVALADVEQGSRAALQGRGMRIGSGAGAGGSADAMATMLEVRIKRRSDGTVIWEGRALAEAGGSDRAATVEQLSNALFRDFPGESGRTIRTR